MNEYDNLSWLYTFELGSFVDDVISICNWNISWFEHPQKIQRRRMRKEGRIRRTGVVRRINFAEREDCENSNL